jgi:hypothetical protein
VQPSEFLSKRAFLCKAAAASSSAARMTGMRRLALAALVAIPCWTFAGAILWHAPHPFLMASVSACTVSAYLAIRSWSGGSR